MPIALTAARSNAKSQRTRRRARPRPALLPIAACAAMVVAVGSARAIPVSWIDAADGPWDVAGSWSAGLVPGTLDDVSLALAGTRLITYRQDERFIKSLTLSGGNRLSFTGGALSTQTLTNGSTIDITSGVFNVGSGTSGAMNISGGTLGLTGVLTATGALRLQGGMVQGGTLQQAGVNRLEIASGTLDGATVLGTLNIGDAANPSASLRVNNGLTVKTEAGGLPGVVNVAANPGAASYNILSFNGTQSFDNATINIGSADNPYGWVALDSGGTFTLGANARVQGTGNLGAGYFVGGTNDLVNRGTISANLDGRQLSINNTGTLTNQGTLEARNGGVLSIAPGGGWTNAGVIKVADSTSTVSLGGTLTVASLGTFDNSAGGNLYLAGTLDNTGTTLGFTAATGAMTLQGGTVLGGTLQHSGANALRLSSGTFDGVTVLGTLNIGDAANPSASLRINNGLTVKTEAGGLPGVVNVGVTASGSYNILSFNGTQTFDNATINIGSADNPYGWVALESGGTFTLGANARVQGTGNLGAGYFVGGTNDLVNKGTISANLDGRQLSINNTGTLTNQGTLEARNGGILSIAPGGGWSNAGVIKVADSTSTISLGGTLTVASLGTFDNSAGGNLYLAGTLDNTGTTLGFTAATGAMTLQGGTVLGGTLQHSGANALRLSSGTFDGVTVLGTLNLGDAANPTASLRINNGLTVKTEAGGLPGVVNVGAVASGSYNILSFNGTQTFDNATINIGSADNPYGWVALESGGTFTLGTNARVQGTGNLGAGYFVGGTNDLVNKGTISANLDGRQLSINSSGTLTNQGTLEARDGGVLYVTPGGGLSNLAGTTLTGGTYSIAGDSTIHIAGANILTNAATIRLDGANAALRNASDNSDALANFANNAAGGSFAIRNGRDYTSAGAFSNAGVVQIGAASTFTAGGAYTNQSSAQLLLDGGNYAGSNLANAGQISGFGSIGGPIANTGSVRASGGALTLGGGVQGATGALVIAPGASLTLAAASSAGTLTHQGSVLALGANDITVHQDYDNALTGAGNAYDRRAGVSGTGKILAAGTTTQTLSGAAIANGTSATPTLALGNVRIGQGGVTGSFAINNVGSGGPSLRGALQTGGIGDAALSGSGVTAQNWGPVTQGGSGSAFSITFDPTTGGALAGQTVKLVNNFDNVAAQTLAITGAAYHAAQAAAVTPGVVVLANQRVGGSLTQALTLANIAPAGNYSEKLNATIAASGSATAGGSVSLLAAGASSTALTVGVSTATAGAKSGVATLTLASDGTGTSGLAALALAAQTIDVSGSVYRTATGTAAPDPIAFGNLRVGGSAQRFLTVGNSAAADGYSERLNAQFSAVSGSSVATAGSASGLAAGSSSDNALSVTLNTQAPGAKSGTVTVAFQSDGTGTSGLAAIGAGTQTLGFSGSVFRLAGAATVAPVVLAAQRVGGTATQALTLTNTAPDDGYSERLNASLAASGQATVSGGPISRLAAGASDSSLRVGVDTATAGSKSGTATLTLASDGTGTSGYAPLGLGMQQVGVSGKVYAPAVAVLNTPSVDFGIVRVGDVVAARNVSVGNAATGALTDTLHATLSGGSAPFTAAGSAAVLAGASNTTDLTVQLDTAAAGVFHGTAGVGYTSRNADMADLAVGGADIALAAQVNNLAAALWTKGAGGGSFSGAGSQYVLDFGSLAQGGSALNASLALLNAASGPADALTGRFDLSSLRPGDAFTLTGFDSFAGLTAGDTLSNLQVALGSGAVGSFDRVIVLSSLSTNASDPAGRALGDIELHLRGTVVAVPEPGTWVLMVGGLLLLATRRRARA